MTIRIVVLGRLQPERLDQFKTVADALTRVVVEKESESTLVYEFYSRDNETEWVICETYRDGDALRAHMDHVADLTEGVFASFNTERVIMWGDAPEDMVDLFASFGKFTHFGNKLSAI